MSRRSPPDLNFPHNSQSPRRATAARSTFCLAGCRSRDRPSRGSQNPTALDHHDETVRLGMAGALRELGQLPETIDSKFAGLRP